MKIALLTTILILLAACCALLIGGCATLGAKPDARQKTGFQASKQYHSKEAVFDNRIPGLHAQVMERLSIFQSLMEWVQAEEASPDADLPTVIPDMARFSEPSGSLKIIWFGHSSFMLNLNGVIILVDPVFSSYASPVFFLNRRFQDPPIGLEDLPEADVVVISHDHYDHLDMDSVRFFKDKKAQFLAPLGVGGHLRSWGIPAARIKELDWWQSADIKGVEFIAAPAQHFSGRGFTTGETLWASWVIQGHGHNVFYSGDTGYDVHFTEIGKKYGPFEVAFLECGQYNQKWREVHMLPEETARAYKDLGADWLFPVHWGMFQLSVHPWYDPIVKLSEMHRLGLVDLMAPRMGEIAEVTPEYQARAWWEGCMARSD